jgi:hypothetical protein
MQMKRVIPKVGAAALTLGGGAVAAAGCSSGDAVSAFCNKLADCYGYGRAYVDRCIRENDRRWAEYASYYGPACERSIRRALRCASRLTCREIDYSYYYCRIEYRDIDFYCDYYW